MADFDGSLIEVVTEMDGRWKVFYDGEYAGQVRKADDDGPPFVALFKSTHGGALMQISGADNVDEAAEAAAHQFWLVHKVPEQDS